MIKKQVDEYYNIFGKIYLYVKDLFDAKYQFLINKRESIGPKKLNGPKTFIESSNDMQEVNKILEIATERHNGMY